MISRDPGYNDQERSRPEDKDERAFLLKLNVANADALTEGRSASRQRNRATVPNHQIYSSLSPHS